MPLRTLPAILLVFLLCLPAAAEENLVISTEILPPFVTADGSGFFDALYREVGRRVRLDITIIHLTNKRSLNLTEDGFSGGIGPRPAGLEKEYPHLIRMEEPSILAKFAAFSKKGAPIASWEDLADRHIAYPRGWFVPEGRLPASAHLVRVKATHHGMAMLDAGRVDAALTILELGQHEIARLGYASIGEHPAVLAEGALYLYLNKRHAALVPVLDAVLKDMKRDGTWDRLYRQAMAEHDEKTE